VQSEEAIIMAQLISGAVRRYEGLGLLVLAGALSAGLAIALWSGERRDNPTPIAVVASTLQRSQARPAAPALAADRQGRDVPTPDEQRRRLLLMLMMNSAGPLGPYGKVGR
jgi:hypothetical protein